MGQLSTYGFIVHVVHVAPEKNARKFSARYNLAFF